MSAKFEAPLFRGATKPVMFFGIPVNALLLVSAPSFLAFFMLYDVLGYFSALLLVPIIAGVPVMRQITKRDDQHLNMLMLEFKERFGWLRCNRLHDLTIVPPHNLRKHELLGE